MTQVRFESIVTEVGRYKITQSIQLGRKLELSTFAVGDGDGGYYAISDKQTQLKNQVWAGPLSSVEIGANDKDEIHVKTYIPTDVGGFHIREAGIFDKDGDLIVVALHPETYKPLGDFGAYKDLVIRIIISISNAANVILNVDPSIVHATQADIERLREDIPNIINLDNYQEVSEKGKNNGYAPLGYDGKVPAKHLPVAAKGLELGDTQDTAHRGDHGVKAYEHSLSKHAPTNAYSKEQSDSVVETLRNEALKLGDISTTAYRGDRGKLAYDHSRSKHADPNAITESQANSLIRSYTTKATSAYGSGYVAYKIGSATCVFANWAADGETVPVGFRPSTSKSVVVATNDRGGAKIADAYLSTDGRIDINSSEETTVAVFTF